MIGPLGRRRLPGTQRAELGTEHRRVALVELVQADGGQVLGVHAGPEDHLRTRVRGVSF